MAQETFTKEQVFAELDGLGEAAVRVRLSVDKAYGDSGPKHALVLEWLRRKELSRKEASSLEQIRIARSAKNAAWIAAIAAITAAVVTIIVSYLSLVHR